MELPLTKRRCARSCDECQEARNVLEDLCPDFLLVEILGFLEYEGLLIDNPVLGSRYRFVGVFVKILGVKHRRCGDETIFTHLVRAVSENFMRPRWYPGQEHRNEAFAEACWLGQVPEDTIVEAKLSTWAASWAGVSSPCAEWNYEHVQAWCKKGRYTQVHTPFGWMWDFHRKLDVVHESDK